MSKLAQLPEIDLEILKLVWSEWINPKVGRTVDGGLTREELYAELKEKPLSIHASVTLKRRLRELCDDEPRYLLSQKIAGRGGPFVYKINALTTVTWPSTAFMLIHLWKLKHVESLDLIKAMTAQRSVAFVTDVQGAEERIKAEVEQQVEWCLAHGYLEYVEKHKTEVRPSTRLEYEYRLLQFIARHPDPGRSNVAVIITP